MTANLVRQARAGDHAAFEAIITSAYDRLFAIAHRILRDREAAEDATQDAIVRCWRDLLASAATISLRGRRGCPTSRAAHPRRRNRCAG